MRQIQPQLIEPDIVCADYIAGPCGMVVFGASGDLVRRKLILSLFAVFRRDIISEHFYVIGCGRTLYSDERFRELAREVIGYQESESARNKAEKFISRLFYVSGEYSDGRFYENIKGKAIHLDKQFNVKGPLIFYLSVPHFMYERIVDNLRIAGLSCPAGKIKRETRLIIEKPFGRDLESATELNTMIRRCFTEAQIYRIDHYLGKESVQNILMFRFANGIFEPVWNRNYIDHVQITIAESIGVEHRGGYYDKSGATRDMFQNHVLQMLALVAQEPSTSFQADRLRDEKVKVLRSIRPFDLNRLQEQIVRGQYGPGTVNGQDVVGYRQEDQVTRHSVTETYVAAKLFIDNWRWEGVPFYVRTGKRLSAKDTEIAITFKKVPFSMFRSEGLEDLPPNVLVMQIQPHEGISLCFQAKRPGSKLGMATLDMNFSYKDVFKVEMPESYERLLLDCMSGDQTLFTRSDSIDASWELITPVLEKWEQENSQPFEYPAGSESFAQADKLIESDARKWRRLNDKCSAG